MHEPVRWWISFTGRLLGGALLASLFVTALHDASQGWDVWYYHLPFAARIWRLVPRGEYVFHAANQARYQGFPLLGEILQGLLWKITGRPEAANLVAWCGLVGFVVYLQRRFAVAWPVASLGLLAIPLVQIHATSCYVDLPANVGAAILVLEIYRHYSTDRAPTPRDLALAAVAAGVAAHMRLQLVPLVALGLLALLPHVYRMGWRWVAVLLLCLPVISFWPLKNVFLYRNPVYPVHLTLAGLELPGPDELYRAAPVSLADAPQPLRWFYSIFELGLGPLSARHWSIDQWAPPDSPAYRMGGFSGPYVLALLVMFGLGLWRERSRRSRVAAVVLGSASLVAACSPQSHELRYTLNWVLVLVGLNLALWSARGLGLPASVALVGWLWVLIQTKAMYAFPHGMTFAQLVAAKTEASVIGQLRDGERVCLDRSPWTFLYAARFHRAVRYSIKEREAGSDCSGFRAIP